MESEGKWVLNNSVKANQIVIPRYWNPVWGELNKTNWTDHRNERETAFKTAKERIEAQAAAIKKNAFWDVSYEEDGDDPIFPLQKLHERMEAFIKVPSTDLYNDRGPWGDGDWDGTGGTILDPTKTGPLYELYFGHVPGKEEYYDQSAKANYVYPEGPEGGNDKVGSSGGAQGIMIQDTDGVVLGDGGPLTVSLLQDTAGKKVVPTITGAPKGFDYLKWEITPAAVAGLSEDVAAGTPAPKVTNPFVIPKQDGTATVTVTNCNSTGVPGTITASFTVEVVD
jgi:hypothetical protein